MKHKFYKKKCIGEEKTFYLLATKRFLLVASTYLIVLTSNAQKSPFPDSQLTSTVKGGSIPGLPSAKELQNQLTKNLLQTTPLTKGIKNIEGLYKNPLSLNDVLITYNSIYNNAESLVSLNTPDYYQQLQFNSTWSVLGMPFSMGFQTTDLVNISINRTAFPKLQFQKDVYLDNLKKAISRQLDYAKLESQLKNPFESIKNLAEQAWNKELNLLKASYGQGLQQQIKELGNFDQLLTEDPQAIRRKLLTPELQAKAASIAQQLTDLQSRLNMGEGIDSAQFHSLKQVQTEIAGIQKLVEKIEAHKKHWESSGLVSKLKEWDIFKKQQLMSFLQKPSSITQLSKQYLSLNGIQRLFLKVNKLNAGQNTVSSSPLSMNHFMNNGLLTEINKGKKALTFFMGSPPSVKSLFDNYAGNIEGLKTKASAFQLAGANSQSRISLMSFSESFDEMLGHINPSQKLRQSIITTINKEFRIGSKGRLQTELSRSITNYNNKGGEESQNSGLKELMSTDDFFKNAAFNLTYSDEYPKSDLSYSARIKKVANGYTNPGSAFLNKGSSEAGLFVKKAFLKRQLQLDLRTDVREYKYNDATADKWRNIYSVLNLRWKIKKNQTLALRYQPSRMVRIGNDQKTIFSRFDRLSADMSLSKKIKRLSYYNYSSLAYQKNAYQQLGGNQTSNNLTLISNHTLMVQKQLLFLNTQYNHELTQTHQYYFNSSLTADAGTSYTLFKSIQASSSLAYAGVKDWYEQVGIRQSFTGSINEQLSLHLFIDARKNLRIQQPLLFAPIRGEIGLQYAFNKK